MAITHVTGRIGRTFFDGKGAEVIESWLQGGETRTKRWSAFFDEPHGLKEGDQVEVSGMHGDKIDPWEKDGVPQHTIKRTLNWARIRVGEATTAPSAPEPATSDPWPVADIPDNPWPDTDATPF